MMRATLIALLAVCVGCRGGSHEHGRAPAADDELPGQSVTVWTDLHELFMEYSPLIVGQESRFAAHVTVLPNLAPKGGKVTVTVTTGAAPESASVDGASPAGIFRPVLKPTRAGACTLTVIVERAGATDRIDAGKCEVFSDQAAARKGLAEEEAAPGRITYLKEQSWKTDFATEFATERELIPGIRAPGEIKAVAGKEARVSAPTTGRLAFADVAPTPGMTIEKGQLLATLTPTATGGTDSASLSADVQAARAELAGAQAELARAERLFAERAVPERQVAEARTRVAVARARVSGAGGRLGQFSAGAAGRASRGAFQIRSPIAGTLVALSATTGQTVPEGTPLFTVVDGDRIWLEARIFEPEIPRVEDATSASFTIDGYDTPFRVAPPEGKVIGLGRVLDPDTRTVPLTFELPNPGGRLRLGQFAEVTIETGTPVKVLAVPESAIVDDAGTPVVYVEVEGEAFERRALSLGLRTGGWAQVLSGIEPGERIVTVGAYELKLASSAGSVPAHGHAH